MAKKVKRHVGASSSRMASAHASPILRNSKGPSRLILRLPNHRNIDNDTKKHRKDKLPSPARGARTFPRTVTSSPVSSPETALAVLDNSNDVIPDFALAPTGFHLTYATDSSDEFSELAEDDEDVRGSEEAYLIADKLKKLDKKLRKSSQSPNVTQSQDSDRENPEVAQAQRRKGGPNNRESIMFEIARIRRDSDASQPHAGAPQDAPVTWSGAEDSDLDHLDALLGLTTDESAVLEGHVTSLTRHTSKTMRFEDFMAADDGDESDTSDSDSDVSADDTLRRPPTTSEKIEVTDLDLDNEHIETTQEVLQNGGFVFYKGNCICAGQSISGLPKLLTTFSWSR